MMTSRFYYALASAPDPQSLWNVWDRQAMAQQVQSCHVFYTQSGEDELAHAYGPATHNPNASFPLRFNGRAFGRVEMGGEDIDRGDWEGAVNQLALALVTQQRLMKLQKEAQSAEHLKRCIDEMRNLFGATSVDALLAKLLRAALNICKAQLGAVLLTDNQGQVVDSIELGVTSEWLHSLTDQGGHRLLDGWLEARQHAFFNETTIEEFVDPLELELLDMAYIHLGTSRSTKGAIVIVNLDQQIKHHAFDALSTIAQLMAIEIENVEERQRAEASAYQRHELEMARSLQDSLQVTDPPQIKGLSIAAWNLACDETGGDYVDVIELTPWAVDLMIGDATGHGLAAAMVMVNTRAAMKSLMQTHHTLPEIFALLNNRMEEDTSDNRFMTLFAGRLDRLSGTVSYVSAGHDAALLLRRKTGEIEELEATGLPLGMLSDQDYEIEHTAGLAAGDILLIFTDGLPEAHNQDGAQLGVEPVMEYLQQTPHYDANLIIEDVKKLALDFIGTSKRMDDITMLAVCVEDL
ncbi:MAG: PP2C family protein-serine/threonine phosphatase [Pseudomonadota bacterium]